MKDSIKDDLCDHVESKHLSYPRQKFFRWERKKPLYLRRSIMITSSSYILRITIDLLVNLMVFLSLSEWTFVLNRIDALTRHDHQIIFWLKNQRDAILIPTDRTEVSRDWIWEWVFLSRFLQTLLDLWISFALVYQNFFNSFD